MTDKVNSTSTPKQKTKKPNPPNMSAIYNMFSSCLHCFKLSYFEYLETLKEYKL